MRSSSRLLDSDQMAALLANGLRRRGDPDFDPAPVVLVSDGVRSWLVCSVYPGDFDWAFGLCDIGQGCAEVGDVRLSDIERLDDGGVTVVPPEDDGRRLSDYVASARGTVPARTRP